ncbi:MAG: TrkH family potassium uptake protein [Rhodobacteraceae bacterium]|nr:TrkH family potassium uptake protein [Paracoccaceae bacterium]
MVRFVVNLPLFVLLVGTFAVSMLAVSLHALWLREHMIARSFLYAALLILAALACIALATRGRRRKETALEHWLTLLSAFTVVPVILAVPFHESVGTLRFGDAVVEMISAITTTGMTLFAEPEHIAPSLHLWRAQVAWMGGLIMWVAATTVFAVFHPGGTAQGLRARAPTQGRDIGINRMQMHHWVRATAILLPIYGGLTALLWAALCALGGEVFHALIHAMAIMSTSGISALDGFEHSPAGLGGEGIAFLFLFLALTHKTFSGRGRGLFWDPELRLGLLIVGLVALLLFGRHYLIASSEGGAESLMRAVTAMWGALFTAMSFLTTTGFVSGAWQTTTQWADPGAAGGVASGLGASAMVLIGLSLVGGGVATTAGGVKLLRVFVLYLQGLREMEKLVYPSSVRGRAYHAGTIRRQDAMIAWIFFMFFAISLAMVVLLLTAFGMAFESAMVMAVATLSTTGPLASVAAQAPVDLMGYNHAIKATLCLAMVAGRLEVLAIIALLAPERWRS